MYVYIDDIVVGANTWEEHLSKLSEVFEKLKEFNLTVNLAKCSFVKGTITYLGHEVGSGKVKPINAHIKAIEEFPRPQCSKDIMKFLGTVGYYRRFCRNFSEIADPLTDMLKKDVVFKWDNKREETFQSLKLLLMSKPVLKPPDFSKSFVLQVDASEVGAGSVLLQDYSGILHPVSYFSKKFLKHQRNYSIVEKETLSLILSLKHFEVYLSGNGQSVLVLTDNNPLCFIEKNKGNNKRILRWSLILQDFNLNFQHIKGRDNVIADLLSRY